ncbi:VOC family protein [Sphaerimonospora mesophila]|uniref:VOC family protein n=1 Tax=Sphaerimonospora mesophila TaxID=37483 RepID=UPI0006E2E158
MNLGSLLIGSSAVETMKEWYRAAFDVKENEMGAFTFGSTQLFIEEHSEVSGPTKEPARVILNLDVADCRAIEAHLRTLGVTWVREVEQMPFGLIGTVADPDGNYVQIIQWGAEPESHKD